MPKCKWWQLHHWIFAGDVRVTEPKIGPYDPRQDDARTVTKEIYVCANCGDKSVRDPISLGEFY